MKVNGGCRLESYIRCNRPWAALHSSFPPTMLGIVAAIFLCFLPLHVNGLITADAKCLSGYDWSFSSIGQSPCDVAAELGAACVGVFNVAPLGIGNVYLGPSLTSANTCRCSSVYYSLLSACAHCQGGSYLQWSIYSTNCSTVYLTTYTQPIPVDVKVPAYAYQNVSLSGSFDVILARSYGGTESSRLPYSSTSSYTSSTSSYTSSTSSYISSSSSVAY